MGVQMDDTVSMVAPASHLTPMGLVPKIKLYKVVGLFESGMFEYDSSLAFISIQSAQKFFSMKKKVSGIEIRVDDIDHADKIAKSLQKSLGFPYYARDWMRMNKNLFSALRLEKIVMFIILILINNSRLMRGQTAGLGLNVLLFSVEFFFLFLGVKSLGLIF